MSVIFGIIKKKIPEAEVSFLLPYAIMGALFLAKKKIKGNDAFDIKTKLSTRAGKKFHFPSSKKGKEGLE